MNIRILCRGYHFDRKTIAGPSGEEVEVIDFMFLEAPGQTVTVRLPGGEWEKFRAYVNDPEARRAEIQAQQEAAEARSRITIPGGGRPRNVGSPG